MKTRVIIVGGSTAGWLAVGIIAVKHCTVNNADAVNTDIQQIKVILVESPGVKNLGVG
jgi:hypothetical protein